MKTKTGVSLEVCKWSKILPHCSSYGPAKGLSPPLTTTKLKVFFEKLMAPGKLAFCYVGGAQVSQHRAGFPPQSKPSPWNVVSRMGAWSYDGPSWRARRSTY